MGKSCGKILQEMLLEMLQEMLQENLVGKSCRKILVGNLAGKSF